MPRPSPDAAPSGASGTAIPSMRSAPQRPSRVSWPAESPAPVFCNRAYEAWRRSPPIAARDPAAFSRFGLQQREEICRARHFFHYEGRTLEPSPFAVNPERARNWNSAAPQRTDCPEFSEEIALELAGLGLTEHHATDFPFLAAVQPSNVELPRLARIARCYRGQVVYPNIPSDIPRAFQVRLKEPLQAGEQIFNCAGRRRAHSRNLQPGRPRAQAL